MARPKHSLERRRFFWIGIRAGLSAEDASVAAGAHPGWGKQVLIECGGVNPFKSKSLAGRYLSFQEREDISELKSEGLGVRAIARTLDRDPATISRELKRGAARSGKYRPSVAQAKVDAGRRGPRNAKLATNLALRRVVQEGLLRRESPEQIAGRLEHDFPDDPEMRVSPETIYQSLFIQSRGGLRRELTQHLRTGRSMRKPHRKADERRGRIPGMVMISERPAAIEDRAIPGHWEGDLILGSTASASAVGTLVERTTGFVMLLHLPEDHTALTVQNALVSKMLTLPEQIRLSLTWDQGKEMAHHKTIADETGLDIYFCDPHSPWQRGSNENTNGLLRQYLPKGSDLSFYGPGMLDQIAAELNARPRKRHGFQTPTEVLTQLLSGETTHHGVA